MKQLEMVQFDFGCLQNSSYAHLKKNLKMFTGIPENTIYQQPTSTTGKITAKLCQATIATR